MDVHEVVKERYGAIASGKQESRCGAGSDCGCNTTLYESSLVADLPLDVTEFSLG